MISYIEGKIISIGDRFVTIFVGGLGYSVYTSRDTISNIKIGDEIAMQTILVVREDVLDLYGFKTIFEKDIFSMLTSVSGVGPKSALGVLDVIPAETLVRAISTNDLTSLVAISGIGKKTAEKIILELRDKIVKTGLHDARDLSGETDAFLALSSLGYNTNDIRESLKDVDPSLETNAKIKLALKYLGK